MRDWTELSRKFQILRLKTPGYNLKKFAQDEGLNYGTARINIKVKYEKMADGIYKKGKNEGFKESVRQVGVMDGKQLGYDMMTLHKISSGLISIVLQEIQKKASDGSHALKFDSMTEAVKTFINLAQLLLKVKDEMGGEGETNEGGANLEALLKNILEVSKLQNAQEIEGEQVD